VRPQGQALYSPVSDDSIKRMLFFRDCPFLDVRFDLPAVLSKAPERSE
jgi:hypothetical protein